MTLTQGTNGQWYGSDPVILSRVVDGQTETYVGSSAPFSGVRIDALFEGKKFREESTRWWEERGFTITISPTLQMARDAWFNRDKGDAT